MGWFNDLLVKLGVKQAPKPKRKYVRKAPSKPRVKKEKAAAAGMNVEAEKQPPWANGQLQGGDVNKNPGKDHVAGTYPD